MTNHELQTLLALDRSKLSHDGRPLYNRLIFASSPYLLQHAKNPVNWREWDDEARNEARQRNLPLFVSIGYATCHWCHVMAHESFEDEEVADILNHAFVPVKVDREERPDLDEFCMAACQTMTGSGGWPLNCFLKPDGTPFYTLTYLPKEPRRGMPGFLELLENIATVWQHKPDAVDRNAGSLMEALSQMASPPPPDPNVLLTTLSDQAATTLQRICDHQHGGFGNSPKFPMPPYLLFLLQRENTALHELAFKSLRAMRSGGIWDQLGGGIHRYSTDRQWLVPHFEKMLYDQALVAYAALGAYHISNDTTYREMTDNLLGFVLRELTSPQGGFYCGLDADSEGREGACYVWRKQEIDQLLRDTAALFCDYYGVTAGGNFEEPGENVLFQAVPLPELAARHSLSEADVTSRLEQCHRSLLEQRSLREQPLRDLKILTSWNGLMIAALARGAALTGKQEWLTAARRAAAFIATTLSSDNGRLLRSYLVTASPVKGFLEDYACLAWGYLELHQASHEPTDLVQAGNLCREALCLFRSSDGRLRTAGNDAEQLPITLPDLHDGVIPSGASVLVMNLVRLAEQTDDEAWSKEAQELLRSYQGNLQQAPVNSLWMVLAGLHLLEAGKLASETTTH